MKHAVIAALLLIGGVPNAHADSDVYNTTTKYARSDAELHAATESCAAKFGAPDNGTAIQAMHARAWLAVQSHRARTHLD